jgi:acetolactate synthase I/II/III large subunit
MNLSAVLSRNLLAAGTGKVCGYPVDPSVEFLEPARRVDMGFVVVRREGTAAPMAKA